MQGVAEKVHKVEREVIQLRLLVENVDGRVTMIDGRLGYIENVTG